MSDTYINVSSPEIALSLFKQLAEQQTEDAPHVRLTNGWAVTRVRIPFPPISSSITPSMMSAYIELQNEFYKLAALAKFGAADSRTLSEVDKHELEIFVQISDGSSIHITDWARVLELFARRAAGKLTTKNLTIIILAMASLYAGYCGFSAWLEHKRVVALEEARSAERREALNAIIFSNQQQRETYEFIIRTLMENGPAGRRTAELADTGFSAFLQAIERSGTIEFNGQSVSPTDAALLRQHTRSRPIVNFITEAMRVVNIDTASDVDQMVFMRPSTGEKFRVGFSNTLFYANDREVLFQALRSREEIVVELALREVGGVIRDTQFLRVHQPR